MVTPRDYTEFDFEDHYHRYLAEKCLAFTDCEPAYRLGYDLVYSYPYRNRSWEATGLLDLIADLEAGQPPRNPSGEAAEDASLH